MHHKRKIVFPSKITHVSRRSGRRVNCEHGNVLRYTSIDFHDKRRGGDVGIAAGRCVNYTFIVCLFCFFLIHLLRRLSNNGYNYTVTVLYKLFGLQHARGPRVSCPTDFLFPLFSQACRAVAKEKKTTHSQRYANARTRRK